MNEVLRTLRALLALALTWLGFLLAYGSAVAFSVQVMMHGYPPSRAHVSYEQLVRWFVAGEILIAAGVVLSWLACVVAGRGVWRQWVQGFKSPRPGGAASVFGALLALQMLGWVIVALVNPPAPPADTASFSLAMDVGHSVISGAVGEELIVLAAPIVVMRRVLPGVFARRGFVIIVVAALVVLRLSYHLYQGAWALTHVPWAIGAIVLYLIFGRIWPQIVAHAVYDVVLVLHEHAVITQTAQYALLFLMPLVGLGVGWWQRRRAAHRRLAAST